MNQEWQALREVLRSYRRQEDVQTEVREKLWIPYLTMVYDIVAHYDLLLPFLHL